MLNVNKQTQKFKYKKKYDLHFFIKAGEKKSQSINIVAEGIYGQKKCIQFLVLIWILIHQWMCLYLIHLDMVTLFIAALTSLFTVGKI